MPRKIKLKKVFVNNLKGVDLTIEPSTLTVFTGVSGSGKSSLAFDTLYLEGQRRFIESLSIFAKRQLGEMAKPNLESADGLSPPISIEQKTASHNPRSTVGTMTEIHDFLRVLFARIGKPHCPVSGELVAPQSKETIIKAVQNLPEGTKILLLAPFAKERRGEFREEFRDLLRKGFTRVRIDGTIAHLEEEIQLDGNLTHTVEIVIDRLITSPENRSRIAESITAALTEGKGLCLVVDLQREEELLFSMHAYSPKSGLSYGPLEPHDFSFNSPLGMCPRCQGLGEVIEFDLEKVIDSEKSIKEGCCSLASSYQTVKYGNIYDNLADLFGFSVDTPWKRLSEKAKKIFLHGTEKKWTRMTFVHPRTGARWEDRVQWRGVLEEAHQRYREAKSESYKQKMQQLMREELCPECRGCRIKPYPAATELGGKTITSITKLSVADCAAFFSTLSLTKEESVIGDELIKEIRERLAFLIEVGLHYLTLDRGAPTLSGGEAQRVRLAAQIGSGLVGITYILDEPSIGLHPRDNHRLIATLKKLRAMGNTVVVVEHDEETIWEADRIVDFGPGAGSAGGEILVNGTHEELLAEPRSLTGAYLSGKERIAIPKKRRKKTRATLQLKGCSHNNLKKIDITVPLGLFVAITGVSGSGKSSLISDTLRPALANALHKASQPVGHHQKLLGTSHIDKMIAIDQSPIGRNPRSNPATYIKLFDEIRALFEELPQSRARGFGKGRFSFNVKEGSCMHCQGIGMVKIDMDFMDDLWTTCPSCQGKRFDEETLSIHYKGKNIYEVLEMEVNAACHHFSAIPSIRHKLELLQRVGMGYLKLGQPSTTLSGGEAQRIKLAKELVRPTTGRTLYLLDEPTTGLHFHDIKQLLHLLHELVDRGNSVVVIEHNMDLVKTADWILDMGPEGGEGGGELIGFGTPETIAKKESPTGKALKSHLAPKKQRKPKKTQSRTKEPPIDQILVKGAAQNNLKQIDFAIPHGKVTVCTGPSGSGKSSLAFDTVYAEGQRRYTESLSPYARQFIKQMPKPKVELIEGLFPSIAIEQKIHAGNPRSTVGTQTEIYDYLRLLFTHMGVAHCPETGEVIRSIDKSFVAESLLHYPDGERLHILAPLLLQKQEKFKQIISRLQRLGYLRVRLNGVLYNIEEEELATHFDPKRKNQLDLVIDRLILKKGVESRLAEAIEKAAEMGDNQLIAIIGDEERFFNLAFAAPSSGKAYPAITPHTFSFNAKEGMCPDCLGLGYQYGTDLREHFSFEKESTGSLLLRLCGHLLKKEALERVKAYFSSEGIDLFAPLNTLSSNQLQLVMNGAPADQWFEELHWVGINPFLAKLGKNAKSPFREAVLPLLHEIPCLSCKGSRLNPLARHVTIKNLSISDLSALPAEQALSFIEALAPPPLLEEVALQLKSRLHFLCKMGAGYLSLDRKAPTLSGGEAQRIRLARQMGSGLTGILYVLDEPTVGLHPSDIHRLKQAISSLKELGNTLLMVEHDPLALETADYLLDFGPQSGARGGEITARGTLEEIKKNKKSLTGSYLSGRKQVPKPEKRREPKAGMIQIQNGTLHNLNSFCAEIPIGLLTCLTGVSGSGKSTLLNGLLLPAIKRALLSNSDLVDLGGRGTISGLKSFTKVIEIDQNPIGHTSRSDLCTYVDLLTPLRQLFAEMPLAKSRGLLPRHFSYNHLKGMCTNCWGMGYKKIQIYLLPAVRVPCPECRGLRLNPVSLQVHFKGKNLGQYLDLTVDEARVIFENQPKIRRPLDTLISIGLGYLKLGQEMQSLSGGEAQRIKLSRELKKRSRGPILYLLDEPTRGLHSEDIATLLSVLHRLVDKGHTMVVIEHNVDLIRNADWLLDLGPGAGKAGGKLIASGTPEEVAANPHSLTGRYLNNLT